MVLQQKIFKEHPKLNQPRINKDRETSIPIAVIPYIKSTSDKLTRYLRNYKIETIINTDKKLRIFYQIEYKNRTKKCVVYEILFKDCDKIYVTQTNRCSIVQKYEHQNAFVCILLDISHNIQGTKMGQRRTFEKASI